jgi:hypothetical protein
MDILNFAQTPLISLEAGPKSGKNNLKKSKHRKSSRDIILCDLVARKNFEECVQKGPFW